VSLKANRKCNGPDKAPRILSFRQLSVRAAIAADCKVRDVGPLWWGIEAGERLPGIFVGFPGQIVMEREFGRGQRALTRRRAPDGGSADGRRAGGPEEGNVTYGSMALDRNGGPLVGTWGQRFPMIDVGKAGGHRFAGLPSRAFFPFTTR